jgi:hypothetical protein
MNTLRDQAADAVDMTLDAAAIRFGIYTDKVRESLATWLDGAAKLKATTVRKYIKYLRMIASSSAAKL